MCRDQFRCYSNFGCFSSCYLILKIQGQGGSERQYKGVTDVLKHLYKEGGIRSIFRGAGATLARDGPGSAA